MRVNFKNTLRIGVLVSLIASVLVPLWIFAQNANENQKAGAFCNLISNLASKYDQRVANRETKLEEKRSEIENRIAERWTERDAKLTEKRAKWDTNRDEHFAKLEEKAVTDEQKQALLVFKQAVAAAIAARRAAIDEAISNFRQGVEQAKVDRKSAADALRNAFRNSIQAAFQKAKADCDAGVDPATIRTNFRAEVKAAKDEFEIDRQELEKLQTSMEALINTRREAIKKAIDDFKAAMEKAKTDFKAAFPQEESED
jgi:hypothetical protein